MNPRTVDVQRAQAQWQFDGRSRPEFAAAAGTGQESVWDYPRPPKLVDDGRCIEVFADGVRLARTVHAVRLLETANPPTFYIPANDVRRELLKDGQGETVCEWKGLARYWSLMMGNVTIRNVAWTYSQPFTAFEAIAGHLAFYPSKLECCINGERVASQPGGLYGGWVTADIVGPFKGAPGTEWW